MDRLTYIHRKFRVEELLSQYAFVHLKALGAEVSEVITPPHYPQEYLHVFDLSWSRGRLAATAARASYLPFYYANAKFAIMSLIQGSRI